VLWYASDKRWISEEITASSLDALLATGAIRLLCVQSATGTGKTSGMARAVAHLPEIGIATHRVSLVESNARAFGARPYNDPSAAPYGGARAVLCGEKRISTTLQSIHHADHRDWSQTVVILDEIEQAFRQVLAGTAEGSEREARSRALQWERIKRVLRMAPLTIALDAYATVDTLRMICAETGIHPSQCAMISFTHRPRRGTATRLDSRDALLTAMRQAAQEPTAWEIHGIKQGSLFAACSTRKAAEAHAAVLRDDGHRVLLWTSVTRSSAEVQAWAAHPQSIPHDTVYDAVVASPSIATGVSLDAIQWRLTGDSALDEERADVLRTEGESGLRWPLFRTIAYDGQIHAFHMDDALQAIARVREATRLLWWMPNRSTQTEIPAAATLAAQSLERYARTQRAAGVVPESPEMQIAFASLARASAHFEVARRRSLLGGGSRLAERLASEGWTVLDGDAAPDVASESIIAMTYEERTSALLAAPFAPDVSAPRAEWSAYLRSTTPVERDAGVEAARLQRLLALRGKHATDNALARDVEAIRWLVKEGQRAERAVRIGARAARLAMDEAIYADRWELASLDKHPFAPTDARHHIEAFRLAIDGLHRATVDPRAPHTARISGATLHDWMRWTQARADDLRALLDVEPCTARRAGDRPRSFRAFCRRIGFEVVRASRARGGAPATYRVALHPVVARVVTRRRELDTLARTA
jgi:hypothetical protein